MHASDPHGDRIAPEHPQVPERLRVDMELRNIVKEKEVVDEVINEEKSHIMWLATFMKA